MKATTQERLFWWVGVPALAGVLVVLGVLQYRWSEQVSDATRSQMQSGLQASLLGFRQDFARELAAACLELRPSANNPGKLDAMEIGEQFQHWQQTAAHPSLVAQVYVWQGSEPATLLRLDPNQSQLQRTMWPAAFASLHQHLAAIPAPANRNLARIQSRPERRRRRQAEGRLPEPPLTSFIDQSIPAVAFPWRPHLPAADAGRTPGVATWVIVELNVAVLEKEVFPELTQKYLRGDYNVAVLPGNATDHVLYASPAGFGETQGAAYDASLYLFGNPFRRNDSLRSTPDLFGPGGRVAIPPGARPQQGDERRSPVRLEPFPYSADQGVWQIVVKHHQGSVEAVVTRLRRRHLIASFGVLVLLAVTMAMVLIASQRARRLAALQMNFVAGVSHELRTPLAVISSAAENIGHGVVSDPQQLARYSASILKQTRQLSHLVEQVLFFASTQQKMGQYQLRPVDVSQVIEAALEDTAGIIHAAEVKVERRIEPDLPAVAADFAGLSQCLQNLISNAVKYGGSQRWIRVRAEAEREDGQIRGVQIAVEDRGIGISPQEIKHIFEPFYRSPEVAGSNVHGTGLGLPLARTVVEAMHGQLTVNSEPGRGSSFTIHLAVASGLRSLDSDAADPISGEAAGSYPS